MIYSSDRYPKKGEICTICSSDFYKPASLLFDKVYIGPSNEERDYTDIPRELTFGFKEAEVEINKLVKSFIPDFNRPVDELVSSVLTDVARIYSKFNLNVIPSFQNYNQFTDEIKYGEQIAFEAALNNIKIVNSEKLEWEQIIEFRTDEEAKRKYRNLKLWLKTGLASNSVSQATDLIASKIDDYEWALKKHGLETINGAITFILDFKQASVTASALAGGTAIGGPIGGSIASGLVVLGQITAWVQKRAIVKTEIMRGQNNEIAYIRDVNEKFK